MPLQLLPLPPSEYEMYFRIAYTAFVPGIMELMYPNGMSEEDRRHAADAMRRADSYHPDRMQCFKVVDTDLPDSDPFDKVVGVSHWKIFPRERSEEDMQKEKEQSDKDDEVYGDPPALNAEVIEEFGARTKEYKEKHLGRRPYVLLHVLATRPEHMRRGIGAISMKWGVEKADELGLPMYLEGSPKGVGLYRKWGFEEVDVLPWDATKYGYKEPLTHLCMLRPPKKNA